MLISSQINEKVKFVHVDLSRSGYSFYTNTDWRLQIFTPMLKRSAVMKHLHFDPTPHSEGWGHPEAWLCLAGLSNFSVYDVDGNLAYSNTMKALHLVHVEIGGNSLECASHDFRLLEIKIGPYQPNEKGVD